MERLPNLFGLSREELAVTLAPLIDRSYTAGQIFHWLYARRVTEFGAMTDLPDSLRRLLAERFRIAWPAIKEVGRSTDGSKKYLLNLEDGGEIEAVYIVYGSRITLCLSSQIGCPLDCRFCLTGRMGLLRNLSAGEIAGQVAAITRDSAIDIAQARIVFMGMGEPLNNYDAVLQAFRLLVDPKGFDIAPRRVTLSTAGLVPGIERLATENPRPRLAISLASPDDAKRTELMPINRKYDLARLMEACRRFPLGPREKITFEHVLIDRINDDPGDARKIARLLRGVRAKVNVIPYNEAGVEGFATPASGRVAAFREALWVHGIPATVRWSKGRDIGAACGQLVRETGQAKVRRAPPARSTRRGSSEPPRRGRGQSRSR